MNSKQINFYSHPNELSKFFDFFLLKDSNISIEPFKVEQFVLYQNLDFFKNNEMIFRIILFKKGEETQNIITEFIESQNYYLFDNLESNIIQFDFPVIREKNILYRGRFYFKTGYWKGDDYIKKDPEFIKWATNLFRIFKKQFLTFKEPYTGEYCTDYVKNLLDNNEIVLKQI